MAIFKKTATELSVYKSTLNYAQLIDKNLFILFIIYHLDKKRHVGRFTSNAVTMLLFSRLNIFEL